MAALTVRYGDRNDPGRLLNRFRRRHRLLPAAITVPESAITVLVGNWQFFAFRAFLTDAASA
jgi:hypothetical protein